MKASSQLNPAQSHYVLSRLIEDKKVSARDVVNYLASMQSEIRALENRLEHLRTLSGTSAPARRGRPAKAGKAAKTAKAPKPAKRKVVLSPKQRVSRQLQGVYMSLIRQVPKTRRTAYQKLAQEKGRQAAVDQLKTDLAKKK
ncbi:MAG: hypothetical protein ACSLFQ_22560 [Thermoanaerobaculia bacterium]